LPWVKFRFPRWKESVKIQARAMTNMPEEKELTSCHRESGE